MWANRTEFFYMALTREVSLSPCGLILCMGNFER